MRPERKVLERLRFRADGRALSCLGAMPESHAQHGLQVDVALRARGGGRRQRKQCGEGAIRLVVALPGSLSQQPPRLGCVA